MSNLMDTADYESPWFPPEAESFLAMHIRSSDSRRQADLLVEAELFARAAQYVFEDLAGLRVERPFIELAFLDGPVHREMCNFGRVLVQYSSYLRQFGVRQRGREGSLYLLESVKPDYHERHYANYPVTDETESWLWHGPDE